MSYIFTRSAKEGPTVHAFAHSLSSALVYIREALASCPPSNVHLESGENLMLSEICGQHSIYEELLVALAALCNRVRRNLSCSRVCNDGLNLTRANGFLQKIIPSLTRRQTHFYLTYVSV